MEKAGDGSVHGRLVEDSVGGLRRGTRLGEEGRPGIASLKGCTLCDTGSSVRIDGNNDSPETGTATVISPSPLSVATADLQNPSPSLPLYPNHGVLYLTRVLIHV